MKKTLIFVSILTVVMFLTSSCVENTSPEPSLSMPKSSIGGGSGGAVTPPEVTEGCVVMLYVSEEDPVTIKGFTVEFGSIFSRSVEIWYGSDMQLISEGNTHDFGPVSVRVEDIEQNTNNPELSKALIKLYTN